MKKIITLALSVLMLVSCFSFTYSVSAQDNGVLASFNYYDKCNGVVDGKKTATVEKTEIDGTKVVKVVPTPDTALSNEVRLDCWSLDYSPEQLKGMKYLTVKYRLDAALSNPKPMSVQFYKGKGGISAVSSVLHATENVKAGGWQIAVFDISKINDLLVFEEGKKVSQFHFWPYGQSTAVSGLNASQVMYISDFTFYNKAPDLSGVKLPEVTAGSSAQTTTPAASGDGVLLTIDYPEKNKGIVDKKLTANTEKVTIDGIKALKLTPTPDTALSNEVRVDCYGLGIDSGDVKGTKYISVKYRYDGAADKTQNMEMQIFSFGGVLANHATLKSQATVTSGGWKIAVFDASSFGNAVIEGQKFNQFHLWPYGRSVSVKSLTASDVLYIGDITFHSKAPEGISLPTTTQPSTPSKPAEPAKPSFEILEGDENGFLTSFSYQEKCNGVVDGKKTATTEKTELDGQKVLKVIPTPETALTSQLALDCYSLKLKPSQIANARFLAVKYKYDAPAGTETAKMSIRILGTSDGKRVVTGSIETDSIKPMKIGEWDVAVFNVSAFGDLYYKGSDDPTMFQFHFYPYGKSTSVTNLTANNVLYLGDFSFYTLNPDADTTYTATFKKGHPDLTGEDPDTITLKRGEKFTIPASPYDAIGGEFLGWKSSEDEKLYQPGAEITMPDGNIVYSAVYDFGKVKGDYIALSFLDYHDGSCEGRDNLIITEDILDNKDVVKIVPNPNGKDVKAGAIVDGYSYTPAGIDMGTYKYVVISYYLDGTMPKDAYFFCNIMKRNILTKSYGAKSAEPLQSGKWSLALIDFSAIDEALVPNLSEYILGQMHIYPFNGVSVSELTGNEALYINNLMFFKEKPNLKMHESYMKGYAGGYFQPQGNMTRAEACTVVARLAAGDDVSVPTDKTTAFTDVSADQWYHKYISYVESLGYLKGYTGNFLPNQPITRAEFVELVYNMGLLKDAGKNGVFTDVAADHPRAAVIAAAGKAGLVNGYDNGDGTFSFKPDATITRAEVVKVINNAYGRSITKNQLSPEVKYSYLDVEKDFWAYADIIEASLSHIEDDKSWIMCMTSPFAIFGTTNDTLDYAAGEAYVKELDAISAKKIEEIRNTPNMDLSAVTGTKYYISSVNGNDANDGKSPETAWKTIARMVKEKPNMKMGDVVLFERGSMWRERFSTKTGITYTAYGEGPKPILYGSPENGAGAENWTLMEGTTNIWVYKNDLLDVGGIFCDGGKVIGLKEVPDFMNGNYYVRKSKGTKPYDIKTELNENYEFVSIINSTDVKTVKGKLYFRCDEGNPGALFSQIEFNINGSIIANGNATDVTVDNLCLMYTGVHGISSGTTKNLTVTNCEIAWIGGTIQTYKDGVATRLGNGIEIYGGCDGYYVDNNYIWQCYDAGATHQYAKGGTTNISMYNAYYTNNIIEDCIYNIEYFTGYADTETTVRDGKNFYITNNILRRSGYGWGNQRPDGNTSAHIKSWSHRNEYEKGTYVIEGNIFDRGSWNLLQTIATYSAWCPIYKNNTYVQVVDEGLCEHKSLKLKYDCFAEQAIKYEMGDENAKVYFLPTSYKHTGFLSRS